MREIDDCDMRKFGALYICKKAIAILGDDGGHRRRNREGIRQAKYFYLVCYIWEKNLMSAQMLEVSLLGVGTALIFERDAVNGQTTKASNKNGNHPPHLSIDLTTPEIKSINWRRSSICKRIASQAVLMMQLTLNATRPTPHGASCLVQAVPVWYVKTRRASSGIVRMRGSIGTRLRPCTT